MGRIPAPGDSNQSMSYAGTPSPSRSPPAVIDRPFGMFFAVLVVLAAFCGCNRNTPTAGGPAATAPTITVVKPTKKAISRVIEQPGAVMPYEETRLFAKLSGFVKSISVDENSKRPIDIGARVKS